MSALPDFLKPYFWDVDFSSLDTYKNSVYIINRLLDKGGLRAAKWIEKTFSPELIKQTLCTRRDFSLRNASFWSTIYNIPLNQIKCFQEPYRTMRRTLWPY